MEAPCPGRAQLFQGGSSFPLRERTRSSTQRSPETWPSLFPKVRSQAGGEGRHPALCSPPGQICWGSRRGPVCPWGYVRISKVKPAGAAPTGKSARPLPPATPPAPPHWPRSGSWVRAILLLGTLPFLSFPTIY